MKTLEVARLRLRNQRLASAPASSPADVVRGLGAVQAQDYLGSLWALGLRARRATEASVERAVADGSIVRSWPLRGTLHFVAAEDLRWMLELAASRTVARSASRYRQLELDEATFAKSNRVLARALRDGKRLTRPELAAELRRAGIPTDGQRLIHLLNRSALDGLTCYAARRGKQFTFALLDEWAPGVRRLEHEESLAELAGRYFKSRGPATLRDFVWWSGLTAADARAGLELAQPRLSREVFDGETYWLASSAPDVRDDAPGAFLLPAFDEYTVAYKDRGAVLDPSHAPLVNAGGGILGPTVVVGGRVVGTWKRELKKDSVVVSTNLFVALKPSERRAVGEAAQRYGEFLGLPAESA
jgi:hypothetical protein